MSFEFQKNQRLMGAILRLIQVCGLLLGLFIILTYLVIFRMQMLGAGMMPTIRSGQYVSMLRRSLFLGEPRRGDIVAVRVSGEPSVVLVRRITAMPGDVVQWQAKDYTLGPGQYFVEGDGRGVSLDSRVLGPISDGQIIGLMLGDYGSGPAGE